MSTYPLDKLLLLWKQKEMDAEMMVGHLLQNLILLEKRVVALEKGQKHREVAGVLTPTDPNAKIPSSAQQKERQR